MIPDPTFNRFEASRRIAELHAFAAAERSVRGASRSEARGLTAAVRGSVRRLFAASSPRTAAGTR